MEPKSRSTQPPRRSNLSGRLGRFAPAAACAASLTLQVVAQSSSPAIFVANNGSTEGSVSSLRVLPDGSLELVDKVVLGTSSGGSDLDPGTHAVTISLSPSGRWLAIGHATPNETVERVSLVEVRPDATLHSTGSFSTPDSPLCVRWLAEGLLAVTRSSLQTGSAVLTYQVDAVTSSAVLIDSLATGAFTTWLAPHPNGSWLYAQDALGGLVFTLAVEGGGSLDYVQVLGTVGYPLGLGVSPDGGLLVAGGGVGAGGKAVLVFAIDQSSGALAAAAGSPFNSPGSSPKQVCFSEDGALAFVGHGGDSTIRSFLVDAATGALTPTGHFVKIGVQGSLGEIAVRGERLFATDRDTLVDGVRGALSFSIQPDGSLQQNGPIVDTLGLVPNAIATWTPRPQLLGDLDGDGAVTGADLGLLLAAWGDAGSPADLDGNGVVDGGDLGILLAGWSDQPK